jgi:hypothetical protein
MIRGRFGNTSGRPFLEALVIFQDLNIKSGISFLVDTGADRTVIMPADWKRLGIDCKKLGKPELATGTSGNCLNYPTQAFILVEDKKTLLVYDVEVFITEDHPEIADLPSLLGRDVLARWRMNYSPGKKRLIFHPITADQYLPIKDKKNHPVPDLDNLPD